MRLIVAILVVVGSVALAEAGNGVVLEAYTRKRPVDADRLLPVIFEELAGRGFDAGPEVVGRKLERMTKPVLTGGFPPDFSEKVEQGHRAWVSGKFDEAVSVLSPIVTAAHANPGAFAQQDSLRPKLLKALIALALSQQRMGDQAATRETFGEILRSFPETVLSRGTYGPDAYNLFEQVRKETAAAGRGRLTVRVTNPSAAIFVNERITKVGVFERADLVPGEYRVFAQLGTKLSRSHRVVVKPNDEATLAIDFEFDQVVQTSPGWTGFLFEDDASREKHESAYGAQFANAIDARAAIVIGIDQVRGRPALVGALVNLINGREIRRASLALDPEPPTDRLRALARFLAGDDPTAGIEVQLAGDAATGPLPPTPTGPADTPAPARSTMWGGWKYITGGLALAALGTGGYLLAIDGTCPDGSDTCGNVYNTSGPGWAAIGGGVALTGLTVYLVVRGRRGDAPSRSAYVVPTSGGALAGFSTSF